MQDKTVSCYALHKCHSLQFLNEADDRNSTSIPSGHDEIMGDY